MSVDEVDDRKWERTGRYRRTKSGLQVAWAHRDSSGQDFSYDTMEWRDVPKEDQPARLEGP